MGTDRGKMIDEVVWDKGRYVGLTRAMARSGPIGEELRVRNSCVPLMFASCK